MKGVQSIEYRGVFVTAVSRGLIVASIDGNVSKTRSLSCLPRSTVLRDNVAVRPECAEPFDVLVSPLPRSQIPQDLDYRFTRHDKQDEYGGHANKQADCGDMEAIPGTWGLGRFGLAGG